MSNQKIKILYLIPTLDKGGAERLLLDLVKKIDKDKYQVGVICLQTLGKWGFELKRAGVPAFSIGKKRRGSIATLLTLYGILKTHQPDILHTHLFGADLYGFLAGRLAKVPLIVSTEHNLNYGESSLRRFLKKRLVPKMDKVIAVSAAVKGYLRNEGIETANVEIIHNGIDLDRFTEPQAIEEHKGTIIGSIGRLSAQKDYDTLVEAMIVLQGEDVSCLIVGDGKERERLEAKAGKAKIQNRVIFAGKQEAVSEFLQKIDIFVLPSRWEGFGLVLLEAGAAKLPVVASNVDGIREIITDNENGLLFEAGNPGDLANRIKEMISNVKMRKELAEKLNMDVKEKFSIDRMTKKYEILYIKLLHSRRLEKSDSSNFEESDFSRPVV